VEIFEEIGHEQKRFVILKRKGDGMPIIVKVPPSKRKDFERIAAHVSNDQFHWEAGFADIDGHTAVRGISLGNRTAAICFNVSPRGYKQQLAYKVTFLSEK
jgi:hypothetical protein